MDREKQVEEKHELSESIYMSGYGLDWKDSDDIAEQLYNAGYRNQSEVSREIFEEIEDRMSCFEDDDDGYLLKKCEFEFFMRELKKKYTEESGNDR